MTFMDSKGCLVHIVRLNPDLVITRSQIQFRKHFSLVHPTAPLPQGLKSYTSQLLGSRPYNPHTFSMSHRPFLPIKQGMSKGFGWGGLSQNLKAPGRFFQSHPLGKKGTCTVLLTRAGFLAVS